MQIQLSTRNDRSFNISRIKVNQTLFLSYSDGWSTDPNKGTDAKTPIEKLELAYVNISPDGDVGFNYKTIGGYKYSGPEFTGKDLQHLLSIGAISIDE